MEGYIKLQIKEIERYGRFIKKEGDAIVIAWVKNGLAKRFAMKHRSEFGLIEEVV